MTKENSKAKKKKSISCFLLIVFSHLCVNSASKFFKSLHAFCIKTSRKLEEKEIKFVICLNNSKEFLPLESISFGWTGFRMWVLMEI